jgi:hypothetical protein
MLMLVELEIGPPAGKIAGVSTVLGYAAIPWLSVGPVKPGPPAATYPLLAPDVLALTQNEYNSPFVRVN